MRKQKIPILILALLTGVVTFSHRSSLAAEKEKKITGSIAVKGVGKSQFPGLARIPSVDARSLALAAYPGRLISMALESEDGCLVYAFDIAGSASDRREVLIDAGNGKMLSNQSKSSNGDGDREKNDDEGED